MNDPASTASTNLPSAAQEIIDQLQLEPHPEGGWYRQTFRDEQVVVTHVEQAVEQPARRPHGQPDSQPDEQAEQQAAGEVRSTAIYYLLARGERSHWHRVRNAVEVWHHYAGDALRLRISPDGVAVEQHVLGTDLNAGQRPQVLVPADRWQSAEPLGEWTLVGCTVAPGFDFSNFELAEPDWQPGA